MGTIWPYVALSALALAVVLWAELTHRTLWNAIMKPVASAGFLAAAIANGALATIFGQALFIALAWSFLGDVLLIPKRSRPAFMMGIGAFLMSHLGYVMVFQLRGIDGAATLAALGGLAVVGFFVWRWLAPHLRGGMRYAVMAYIAVITLMVAFAIGTTVAAPHVLPLLAATLFWLSDLTVARHRFIKEEPANRLVGLPLYYAAQFLFVAALPALLPAGLVVPA